MSTRLLFAMALLLAGLATPVLSAAPASAQATGPVATLEAIPYDVGIHGHPMWDPWFDVGAFGYEAHEFFASGTAVDADGTEADYVTRFVVTRPSDAADFSGTVVLDWVNVTAQFENAVNSLTSVEYLLREGWAWVHVSAQAAGVCCTPLTPKIYDPVRYAPLSHPGDAFANDMFTQLARTFDVPGKVDPMGGLPVEVLLAAGQSQSATRLTDYVKTTQAGAGVIDGFLIQANGSADPGKTWEAAPAAPVFNLLGEREATTLEPSTWPTYRLWEIAGSAHADGWIGRQQTEGASTRIAGAGRQSRSMAEALWQSAGSYGEQADPREAVCTVNGALFPTRYAVNAALDHLDRWVRDDVAPPDAPRYEFSGGQLARDADRNALGGLRLPAIDVPVARYESAACNLGGITIPFTELELIDRYGDHQSYYDQLVQATAASVAAGHFLPADAEDFLARACGARLRFGDTSSGPCTSDFTAEPEPDPEPEPAPAPEPAPQPEPAPLPATGGGLALAALAVLAAGARRGAR